MNPFRLVSLCLAAALLAAAPLAAAPAVDETRASDDRVSELERKVEILTDELARTQRGTVTQRLRRSMPATTARPTDDSG